VTSPRRYLWLTLLVLTLWRLWIAAQVGLGVDEAHYVLYGRYLDLSYFDHPPLVGWIHAVFQALPVSKDFLARVPAVLISLGTSVLAFRFLFRHGFSEAAAAFAVILLNVTPLYNGLSLILLPDSTLMPLGFLIIEATENIVSRKSLRSWLWLGLLLGLAGLSKYTAILFVPALAVYFLREKRWKEVLTWRFLAGVAVAAVVVSPILIWNLKNDFISFSYQSDHVLAFHNFSLMNFVQTWGSQWVLWGFGPAILAFLAFARLQAWRRSEMLFWLSLSIFGFFVLISFFQTILPHWPLCFFVLMIPWGGALFWESTARKKWGPWVVSSSLVITLPLLFELGFHVLPSKKSALLYRDVYGWDEVMKEAAEIRQRELQGPRTGVAVYNWTLGSRAFYYSPPGTPVFVLDGKNHQFSVWNPVSPLGFDLIVAVEEEKTAETLSQIRCDRVEKVGHRKSTRDQAVVNEFSYYRCLGFLGNNTGNSSGS
jgi:4-amino-4-deoxy-L-arabinose transferase-like glycosyltransferase